MPYRVPKYVQKLVRRRTMYSRKLSKAASAVDEYCESIGLNFFHPLYDEACLCSDVRMYCEVDAGENATLKAIETVLNERNSKK